MRIQAQFLGPNISTESLMKLAEEGGAFDFLRDDAEDIYTLEDGEPV